MDGGGVFDFRRVLDELFEGVCCVNRLGRIVVWNAGAERITGWLRREVVGSSALHEVLRHGDVPKGGSCTDGPPLLTALESGVVVQAPLLLFGRVGEPMLVQVRAAPLYGSTGSPVGAVEVFSALGLALAYGAATPSEDHAQRCTKTSMDRRSWGEMSTNRAP